MGIGLVVGSSLVVSLTINSDENCDTFLIFAKNKDRWYTLEGFNEYPRFMFLSKNKKK